MKYIIRTVQDGKRMDVNAVELKRQGVKDQLLTAGMQYLEYEGLLGSYDALGRRIEEQVTIIEPVTVENYV